MRICALLAWYDERPDFLYNAVRSLDNAGVTSLVAIDGPYALYPHRQVRSPASNVEAIATAAYETGLRLLLDQPDQPWATEMDKRTRLFHLGDTIGDDWFLVHDGDHIITRSPGDLHAKLDRTTKDVAAAVVTEPRPDGPTSTFRMPLLYRATPGIQVEGDHFTYVHPDGRHLWGQNTTEPTLNLSLTVQHLTHYRSQHRRDQAQQYYRTRDSQGTELGTCDRCSAKATHSLPTDWQPHQPGQLTAAWTSVCPIHAAQVEQENQQTIRAHGLDPDDVKVTMQKVAA